MGILKKIFGNEKSVDNLLGEDGLVRKAGGWIGNMKYTEEEKAEANSQIRHWAIDYLKAMAPFKLVQRYLTLTIVFIWAFTAFNIIIGFWIEALFPSVKIVDGLLKFAFSDYIFWPMMAAVSLYLSGGVVESVKRKIKD